MKGPAHLQTKQLTSTRGPSVGMILIRDVSYGIIPQATKDGSAVGTWTQMEMRIYEPFVCLIRTESIETGGNIPVTSH